MRSVVAIIAFWSCADGDEGDPAGLVDFAGALKVPSIKVPLVGPDDDLAALAFDWKVVGDDVWRGMTDALNALSSEELRRIIDEVVRIVSDSVVRSAHSAQQQLRLDWGAGGPAT